MKTTVTIEDDVSSLLANAAQVIGVGLTKLVNDLLREALTKNPRFRKVVPKPFTQRTYDLGWHAGMSSEKLQQILHDEEAEAYRQGESRAR